MRKLVKIPKADHEILQGHLFNGDGKESIAFALCGTVSAEGFHVLCVYELFILENDKCLERTEDLIRWPVKEIQQLINKGSKNNMALVKIHCHPMGFARFSETDDLADEELFESIHNLIDDVEFHASIVALPDGSYFGRFIDEQTQFQKIDEVRVISRAISIAKCHANNDDLGRNLRSIQAFGEGTFNTLSNMKITIVGCSGTGSPTAVQLSRLGVGELILIDPDIIERKNLNRILCSKESDIGKFKTDVLFRELSEIGSPTKIVSLPVNIYDSIEALEHLKTSDLIIGCVDSVDGRHLLNQIATFYLIPYIDIGVKLIASDDEGVDKICFTLHFLSPGQSLMSRKVYDGETLRSSSMLRSDPLEYEGRLKEGYIKNAVVESPAVITLNMIASSNAVQDILARIHEYRDGKLSKYDIQRWELVDDYKQVQEDKSLDIYLERHIGRGDIEPLVNMAQLSDVRIEKCHEEITV